MNVRPMFPILLLAIGCGTSEPPAASPSPSPMAMATPSPSGPTLEAQVVTVDPAGPSITLREGDVAPTASPRAGDLREGDRTIRVESAAAAALSTLKPGDRVRVTCMALPETGMGMPGASPMAGMASPGMASPMGGMASPGMASPGMMGGMATGLAGCDSIVSITPMGATGM